MSVNTVANKKQKKEKYEYIIQLRLNHRSL